MSLNNATDKTLREGTARVGDRKATKQECAEELERRIAKRRLEQEKRRK